jgi:hypothetical protein
LPSSRACSVGDGGGDGVGVSSRFCGKIPCLRSASLLYSGLDRLDLVRGHSQFGILVDVHGLAYTSSFLRYFPTFIDNLTAVKLGIATRRTQSFTAGIEWSGACCGAVSTLESLTISDIDDCRRAGSSNDINFLGRPHSPSASPLQHGRSRLSCVSRGTGTICPRA